MNTNEPEYFLFDFDSVAGLHSNVPIISFFSMNTITLEATDALLDDCLSASNQFDAPEKDTSVTTQEVKTVLSTIESRQSQTKEAREAWEAHCRLHAYHGANVRM